MEGNVHRIEQKLEDNTRKLKENRRLEEKEIELTKKN